MSATTAILVAVAIGVGLNAAVYALAELHFFLKRRAHRASALRAFDAEFGTDA